MAEENDDLVHIQFIVKKSLRKKFKSKCLLRDINPSEWLRHQVEKFVKEDKK